MPKFGVKSKAALATCHPDLQILMNEVIKTYDCIISYGYRSPEEQFELYKKGRKLIAGVWVKVGPTVTYKDGYKKKSNHNSKPSMAVDVTPYPLNWKDYAEFKKMAKIILDTADRLYKEGKIKSKIGWGGNWKVFKDYPHFEIKK